MQSLNLPPVDLRLKRDEDKVKLFDVIRKKYVVCTPEEWVRQHFIHFLINEKKVPAGLVVLEQTITLNTMSRRPDILVFNRDGKPVLIVECKASEVEINQDTFDQIARYNSVIKAPFLVVTNGIKHFVCRMDLQNSSYSFLEDVPDYDEMISNLFN